ncbi:hypothetical protein HYH03_000307 [Edaphochlamys debaryana]|uniref:Coenzyme Q-binding protein COQ10 START domain-containing protein n=1 Tax=Edaphochlamys debaryana TaxID=47281 RepID=A0A836C7I1_9CHLO|nr:hypothetical protein HYH03_000307 [Edaphochlamys debaryana]|eukprot:KAG2501807.1 hypothetical protein HYH03_000307 [Edaphochlamys debaryana]
MGGEQSQSPAGGDQAGSQAPGAAPGKKQKAHDTVESWEEKGQRITVTEGNGFLYNLQLRAKVDSSPDAIYDILTDPDTNSVFRSIKECTYRKVLEEDKKAGTRKLEVWHKAIARFLFISVTFETRLYVWEDDRARVIRFTTAKPGMMQKFDGCWRVKPFTQETLDSIYHPERMAKHKQQAHGPFGPGGLLGFMHRPVQADESLVTLEQSILPRGPTPMGIKGLVRGLCAHQLRCMMEDLRRELQRRKEGKSEVLKRRKERQAAAAATAEGSGGKGGGFGLRQASAPAASMTLAGMDLWDAAAPINITIHI